MYLPTQFAWTDTADLVAFCRAHPFATLVAEGADGLEAQHLPVLTDLQDGRVVLRAHAALADPLWRATRVLAVFSGPHAYISAAWYGEADTVPTWNYLAVHASGPVTLIEDPAEIAGGFSRLAAHDGDRQRWQDGLSPAMYARLVGAIRWFRIDVTHLVGKAKLSQHHPPERRQRAITQLRASGDPAARATGEAMARALAGAPPWTNSEATP